MAYTNAFPIETTYSMAMIRDMVISNHALRRAASSTWEAF